MRPVSVGPGQVERPLVLVTLGTIFNAASGVIRMLVGGLTAVDADILVATGDPEASLSLAPIASMPSPDATVRRLESLVREGA